MADFRKETLIKVLREEFGITSAAQLLDAIGTMKKLDISQFVLLPALKGEERHGAAQS